MTLLQAMQSRLLFVNGWVENPSFVETRSTRTLHLHAKRKEAMIGICPIQYSILEGKKETNWGKVQMPNWGRRVSYLGWLTGRETWNHSMSNQSLWPPSSRHGQQRNFIMRITKLYRDLGGGSNGGTCTGFRTPDGIWIQKYRMYSILPLTWSLL